MQSCQNAAMLGSICLLALLLAQDWVLDGQLASRLTEEELARGKVLYGSYCERCHGAHGDDTSYSYITPLSGLTLRLGDVRMRQFRGPSFTLRGRSYPTDEARALMGYILTLPGEKGFRRPDAVVSPYLLGHKLWNRNYLVVDVRTDAEFKKSHIRGSVNLPTKALAGLTRPMVSRDCANRILIVYDEGTGVRAAKAWRAIYQSGHARVAVLDGGFAQWESENREVSTQPSASVPANLLVGSPASGDPTAPPRPPGPVLELRFDPAKTVADSGFLPASQMTAYLDSVGFKGKGIYLVRGRPEACDLLAFQLHLLGFAVDPRGKGEIIVR